MKQCVKGSVCTPLFTTSGPRLSLSLVLSFTPSLGLTSSWVVPYSSPQPWAPLSFLRVTCLWLPLPSLSLPLSYFYLLAIRRDGRGKALPYPLRDDHWKAHTPLFIFCWSHLGCMTTLSAGLLILVSVHILCQYKFTCFTGIFFLSFFFFKWTWWVFKKYLFGCVGS